MSTAIEAPRHFCMLGSQQTVLAIQRAVPVLHADLAVEENYGVG